MRRSITRRSHRSAQGDRPTLRSITPTRATLACLISSLDSGEKRGKPVRNMYIFPPGVRTTNPETRTEGRRPEQPINQARTAIRPQGKGLSFLTKARPTEVEGMTSLVPGLSGIAERVRSVFSHACA